MNERSTEPLRGMSNSDDELAILSSADPVTGLSSSIERTRQDLVAEMAMAIPAAGRQARPHHPVPRLRRMLLVSVGIVMIASAFGFALTARTNIFSGPETGDESEWLRSDADDFEEVVVELISQQSMPLPPGSSIDQVAREIALDGLKQPVFISEEGVLGTFAFKARCSWEGYWLDGYNQSDKKKMEEATEILVQVPSWQIVIATDGGGMVEHHEEIARAARLRHPNVLQEDFDINCGKTSGVGH